MTSYTATINVKGVIKTLKHGINQSTINVKGVTYNFGSTTRISGCKFKHLAVGDEVLIKKIRTKTRYCSHIEIIDVTGKWNDILKADTKYSIDHNLEIGNNVIRPDIISPTISIFSINKIREVIDNNMSERDRKILELHLEGKTGSMISQVVKGITKRQIDRIIKKYRELLK